MVGSRLSSNVRRSKQDSNPQPLPIHQTCINLLFSCSPFHFYLILFLIYILHSLLSVNGGWTEWSEPACPVTCGGASKTRTRTCTNPAPADGGADCDGVKKETESCGTAMCPGKSAKINSFHTASRREQKKCPKRCLNFQKMSKLQNFITIFGITMENAFK